MNKDVEAALSSFVEAMDELLIEGADVASEVMARYETLRKAMAEDAIDRLREAVADLDLSADLCVFGKDFWLSKFDEESECRSESDV